MPFQTILALQLCFADVGANAGVIFLIVIGVFFVITGFARR